MVKTRTKKQQQSQLAGMEVLPVSEGRFERVADRLIDAEVKKRKRSYNWANDGEAFAHLFVQYRFDLGEDEAAQWCQVGRAGHDRGIDAYYLEEDPTAGTGTFYIVQTKSSRTTHDDQVLHKDVRKAMDFLTSDKVEGVKPTLREALETFRESVQNRYDIIVVLGLNGSADKVREAVTGFEPQLPFKCQVEVFDADDIRALVMRSQVIPRDGPTVVFNLPVQPWELNLGNQFPKMISCAVRAKELAGYIRKHRLGVFSLNVREYLGSKNPVNRIVAESLRKNPERFYYLNLGIDAVCEEVKPMGTAENLTGQKTWSLRVKNFQIINGCQTAKTISEVDPDPQALVMIRLIQLDRGERERLVPEISVAKNRQSPIHGRDLFAWDRNQLRLKKEFEKLGVFFETREREWDALRLTRADAKKVFPKGKLDNTLAARSYLSVFLQDPFRAKHRKKEFFQHDHEGGAFEKIFSATSATQMLLSANIYQFVSGKCKEAGKTFRKLGEQAERRPLTDEERFKHEESNVIWNGDTFLAGLIGYFLGHYYALDLKDDKDLTLTQHLLKQIPSSESKKVLELLYDFARETTVQTYRLLRGQQPNPELYTPRRFFYLESTYDLLKGQAHAKSLHSLNSVLKPLKG